MTHSIEGNDQVGYRVVDSKIGPLTGRQLTAAEALRVAGIKEKPAAKPAAAKRAPRAAAKKPATPAAAPAIPADVTSTDES